MQIAIVISIQKWKDLECYVAHSSQTLKKKKGQTLYFAKQCGDVNSK